MGSRVEEAKKKAARAAVEEYVEPELARGGGGGRPLVLGVGSGSTIVYVVERLLEVVAQHRAAADSTRAMREVVCVPTSFQASQLVQQAPHGLLHLADLARYPEVDVAIDGADEVDADLQLIKGGGGCCTQEKIVAAQAKKFVVVADYRKRSAVLGENWRKGVPIEIIPSSHAPLARKFEALGGRPVLRMGEPAKAGPCITDNGNWIVDVDFGSIPDPAGLHTKLKLLTGVVETGLFIDMAEKVFFGQEDGSVATLTKKS